MRMKEILYDLVAVLASESLKHDHNVDKYAEECLIICAASKIVQ